LHEKHGLVPFFLDTRETPASCRFSLGNLRLLGLRVASCHAVLRRGRLVVIEGLPVPWSRAVAASEARMAQRSRHAVSAGLEARSERPGDAVRAAPGMLHEKHGLVPFFLCNLRLLVRSVASCDTVRAAPARSERPGDTAGTGKK
jgi:hypothetical protein